MNIKKAFSVLCSVLPLLTSAYVHAENAKVSYDWGQVKIGGGGYVTGVMFHPLEEGLAYARTDVGGMYRFDKGTDSWQQLFDHPLEQNHLYGVDGFAVAPDDADTVYAALGMYYWNSGGLYKSEDRGKSWTKLVSARCNGNKERRNYGECIAIDEADTDVIYFGTRYEGLLRSENGGQTWKKINSVEFEVDTEKTFGIRNIVIDASGSTASNGASEIVYVGSAGKGVYKSTDGGMTFSLLENSPDEPFRMAVNKNGILYVSDNNGLFKYDGKTWTDISPLKAVPYQGMEIDSNGTIYVSVNTGNKMRMPIYVSSDEGASWRDTFSSFKCTEQAQWFESDNFSSNTASIAIDPFNEKHIMLSDWFGIWETNDITEEPVVSWEQNINGIEEICPYKAVCPPRGESYIHLGVADNDGFSINDVSEFPIRKFNDRFKSYGGPRIQSTTDLAFCEEDPNILVRAGIGYSQEAVAYSLDGGKSWQEFDSSPLEGYTAQGCAVAVSAKKNSDTACPTIIFNQGGYKVKLSRDMGKTWTELPFENIKTKKGDRDYNKLESDKVNPDKFYILDNDNVLNISDDGGKSWYKGVTVPLSTGYRHIRTAPGMENEIWIGVGGEKLYRSSDGAKTMTAVEAITNVHAFCFGKPMRGSEYPTAFVYGSYNGKAGIYRSVDMGQSWVNITPDDFVLKAAVFMEGDRQHEGVVYFCHSGTGLYYLAPDGAGLKPFGTVYEKKNVKYNSDFSLNADGWSMSGNMKNIDSSLGCGAWANGKAILEEYEFSDSYRIYATAICKGSKSGNKLRLMFNYTDDDNFFALEILGGDNSLNNGGARLFKKVNGTTYIYSNNDWYENTTENSDIISEGIVNYKTNSYTYSYKIIVEKEGYITVYRCDSKGAETLMFENCSAAELKKGKIGFYAGGTTGNLSSISVKQQAVMVKGVISDTANTVVDIADNGYVKNFRVLYCEKDDSGKLTDLYITEPVTGSMKVYLPKVSEGNKAEISIFNTLDDLYPLTDKISIEKQ